jgi:ribonuclease P/MRP protein subunit RPP1
MECVEKGFFFEIPYSPCIRDGTARRRIIAQSHNYHAVGKSKNIIISSEALTPLELRGPHDVANLGFIFGLNEQQGKEAVKNSAILAVQNAAGRKLGPYRALIQNKADLTSSEMWKIPDDSSESEENESSSSSESEEKSDENSAKMDNE